VYQAAGNRLNTAVIKTIRATSNSAGMIQVFFYPKTGLYDPYSGSIAAIEVRELMTADTLEGLQNTIAAVSNRSNVSLDLSTEVFPNPSSSGFNVRMTSSLKTEALLNIVDNAGSVIYSRRINAGTYYQVGQNLKPGLYYITVRQGVQSKTMKVVKQ
jgi:hypothetical protein